MIIVNKQKYKVVESLGYQRGTYAKVILVDGVERIVTGGRGHWEFAKPMILPCGRITGQSVNEQIGPY